MPSADTSRRGWALKSRLFVNGIQNADIDSGFVVFMTFSWEWGCRVVNMFLTKRKIIYQLAKSWSNHSQATRNGTDTQTAKLANRTGRKTTTVFVQAA